MGRIVPIVNTDCTSKIFFRRSLEINLNVMLCVVDHVFRFVRVIMMWN